MPPTQRELWLRAAGLFEEMDVWFSTEEPELEVLESIIRDLKYLGVPWEFISNGIAQRGGAEPCEHLWDDAQIPGSDRVCLVCGLLS